MKSQIVQYFESQKEIEISHLNQSNSLQVAGVPEIELEREISKTRTRDRILQLDRHINAINLIS